MKKWLDHVMGLLTMYRLIRYILLAIVVLSFVLSFFGLIEASPLELLASAAVSAAATIGSGLLFSAAFRTRAHFDSSIITGLLLFLLFPPSLNLWFLLALALAGVIASASKYLLAIRGRHIFNPAAIGATIVKILGIWIPALGFPTWWVGSGLLLPLVAVGAVLVLYRTRRLAMGSLFVVVAAALIVGQYALDGESPLTAIGIAFTSYPIVFLAGFMLSEPLTQPPRRWQQLTMAVVVAVLFAVPYNIGSLYSGPEIALVVGNLLAFVFGQRRGIRLTLVSKKQLTPTTWEFSFQPSRPVTFTPGQYMELTVHHRMADSRGMRRVFSISSPPASDGPITFAIKLSDTSSSFKKAFLALVPGSVVHGSLVAGDFSLPGDLDVPVLLVAGGIGITPFASQLAHATVNGHHRDAVVVYAVSDPAEIAYAELLEKSGVRVILLAPEPPTSLPKTWDYVGGGRITRELVLDKVPDVARRRAFVSGPPGLVNDVRGTLRSLGSKRVTTDYFSGY